MSAETVYDQLKHILVTSFQADAEAVLPEAELQELGLDSLDMVELAIVIKTECGVAVTDDELVELQRVDAVVAIVQNRKLAAI